MTCWLNSQQFLRLTAIIFGQLFVSDSAYAQSSESKFGNFQRDKAKSAEALSKESPWVRPPTKINRRSTPGLVHETFVSQLMKVSVGYSVVLPKGYADSKRRYPVVYWLHGGGGNECSSLFTASEWRQSEEQAEQGKALDDVILVYPNAGRSGYMDHFDGKVMLESLIVQELIPLVDEKFRTIARREARAVHGFSMGASGALKFAIKFPELFCSAVAYGGGAIDLENSKDPFITKILDRNLNSEPKLIRENNTYRHLRRNHEQSVELGISFLLICGTEDSWRTSAIDFQAALVTRGISCDLRMVSGVGHNLRGLLKAEGRTAAEFQDGVFQHARTSE